MKRFYAALALAIALLPASDVSEATIRAEAGLAGIYHNGGGLGANISLVLKSDGSYESEWLGCLGVYGKAAGTWRLEANQIIFMPAQERGMLKEFFREAKAFADSGQTGLMRKHDGQFDTEELFLKERKRGE